MASFEIKIEVVAAQADAIDTTLLELEIAGWSLLEDVIAKRAWVVGIFASEAEAKTRWGELEVVLADELLVSRPMIRPLGDLDWKDSYKAHFHAWRFGRLHWVPIWEQNNFRLPAGEAVLWLDPGLAFGTGNHETTRLCVERLVGLAQADGVSGRVIDAGCGSGILALSAALLGYQDIVGFDNDVEAVRVSRENGTLNGLDGRVDFFAADLVGGLSGRSANIVMANIQSDILQRFGKELIEAVAPGGTLILSGILAVERDAVLGAFVQAAPGWASDSRVLGEWSDVVLRRPV
jgi:ribosomal protein L11 methyltransferase